MGRKRSRTDPAKEKLFANALKDLASGKINSIRAAAEYYGLKYETLRDRKKGTETRVEAHENQQHLTKQEEEAVVRWISRVDDWGWPPRIEYVKQMALGFIRSHGIRNPVLGKNWITRFLNRHPQLASKFATRLDKQRSYASNPIILRDFFNKLRRTIAAHGILSENIYNADEKGFMMGQATRVKVVCKREKKHTRKNQDGKREMITVIETVSAGGIVLPPMIIYKGVAHYEGWTALVKKGDKAYFAVSDKGWTSREIGVDYLIKNFEPNTAKQANGATRLIIIDGHDSHVTWEFLDYCLQNNIIPLCLPAHSTHILQPLDVGLFGPLQMHYSQCLDDWMEVGNTGINKGDFYSLLVKAREMTYTVKNILSAFEATGICPLNERRVLEPVKSKLRNQPQLEPHQKTLTFTIPATPCHGRSIMMHGRRTINALPDGTPRSKFNRGMVEKLVHAAARATADNVILSIENSNLRKKATSAVDREKTKSRKEMSKARVITAEDVVRIRLEQEEKERKDAEKKERAAKKKEEKAAKDAEKAIKEAEKAVAIEAGTWVPPKRGRKPKQVVVIDGTEVIDLESVHKGGSDEDYLEEDDSLTMLSTPRVTRRSTRRLD